MSAAAEPTIASVFGLSAKRRRPRHQRVRIAIGCRGRFVEIIVVRTSLPPFVRRERMRGPQVLRAINGGRNGGR